MRREDDPFPRPRFRGRAACLGGSAVGLLLGSLPAMAAVPGVLPRAAPSDAVVRPLPPVDAVAPVTWVGSSDGVTTADAEAAAAGGSAGLLPTPRRETGDAGDAAAGGPPTPESIVRPAPLPRDTADASDPDAGAVPSDRVTLDQIINTTLLMDPRLRAGFENIRLANGDAITASLRPNPTLGVFKGLMPLGEPFTPQVQGGPPQLDVFMQYPIDWFLFGKRVAAMQAANLEVSASQADFANLIRQRVLEAAEAYYDVLEAKALLDLADQDVENFRRVEKITARAVESGGRPRVELSRIRLDRLQAEQAQRNASRDLRIALATLRAVMGLRNADIAFDVAGSLDDLEPREIPGTEEALAIAIANRPDVIARRRRVSQALAEREAQRRNAYPDVAPIAMYTRQYQERALESPDADSFGFGLEMTVPLFDRNQGNRFRADAQTVQNRRELDAALVDLRAEVIAVEQELQAARANAGAVAREQIDLAIEVRSSLNQAYELGGRPLIDVLDAQRNFRETYRIFIVSRAEYGRAIVRFNAVMGRNAVDGTPIPAHCHRVMP
jgi:cobalt-zinc-cadmium efflux system outer membrane protein